MKKHTEEELVKLAKKKLNLEKLKDKQVILHPEISKWRDTEKPDLPMLRSLNNNGQISAVIFRQIKKGIQLLAGARRYAHMKLLGWTWEEIDTDVREKVSDQAALILALEENMIRKDMSPMEEARAVNSLLGSKMSMKAVAKLMNRSPSWVSSRKSLFELPEKVRNAFEKHDLEYSYSTPLKRLGNLLEAQLMLIEKIVGAKTERYYSGGINTVEKAEEFVAGILKEIKDHEELLLKYGPCPACGSKNIGKRMWGDSEEHLYCREDDCDHSWHGITKEPWEWFELKQNAQEMGIELVETAPGSMKVTPKAAADMIARRERREREEVQKAEEEGMDLLKNFRSPVRILALLEPMIAGDNIQKMEVRGEKIEIQLIEALEGSDGEDIYFNALRKDYKAGEKARIETMGWGESDSIKRNHNYINAITAKDPYGDIKTE